MHNPYGILAIARGRQVLVLKSGRLSLQPLHRVAKTRCFSWLPHLVFCCHTVIPQVNFFISFCVVTPSSPRYAAMSLAITLAAVGVYLYETDLDDDRTGGGTAWTRQQGLYPSWFTALEDFFLIFFTADLLLGAIMVDHDWGFWMTTVNQTCRACSLFVLFILSCVPRRDRRFMT